MKGIEDVKNLKEYFNSKNKIISFDFYAHKELERINVKHELIESYFDNTEQEKIDNLAIEFTTKWYKIDSIKEFQKWEDLDLGNLLEIELITFMFEILKKIIGFCKIIEKEKFHKIFSSSLNDIVEFFEQDKSHPVNIPKRNDESLYFDKIEIPLNFGSTTKSIKISRDRYTTIKKISENLTESIFHLKYKFKKNDEIVILLDFNPIIYPNLLKELKSKHENVVLLNQRRPAIWNIESMNIVKNSKCKILNLEDLEENEKNTLLKQEIRKKIEHIWKNEEELREFFSVYDFSFWELIKEKFHKMIEKRFEEAIIRYKQIENIFEKVRVHSILEWAHNGFEEKIVIHIARKNNVSVFLLQHGTAAINEKWKKYHYLMPYFPSQGIKLITWGNAMRDFVLQNKTPKDQVINLGSPRHDTFFSEQNIENENTILIAANGFMHNNFAGNDTRSYDYLEKYFTELCRVVPKISKKQIIVKLHPGQFYYDMKPLIQKIDSNIPIFQNQNIIDLLKKCDVMVSLNYSTALLDAMILQKPTMVVLPEKQGYEKEDFITRNATLFEPNIENIEKALNNILNDTKFRNELIKKGNEFVDYYLVNKGISSTEVAKLLTK